MSYILNDMTKKVRFSLVSIHTVLFFISALKNN